MTTQHGVFFLVDVDNILLDNDAVVRDYRAFLVHAYGPRAGERW